MSVLCWIHSDPRNYQTYVANRLGKLDELTEASSWRWVSTHENPADDATKVKPLKIDMKSQWQKGPEFLQRPKNEWPAQPCISKPDVLSKSIGEIKQILLRHTKGLNFCRTLHDLSSGQGCKDLLHGF